MSRFRFGFARCVTEQKTEANVEARFLSLYSLKCGEPFCVSLKPGESRKNSFPVARETENHHVVFQHPNGNSAPYCLLGFGKDLQMMIKTACQKGLRMTLMAMAGVLFFASNSHAAMITGGDTSVALDATTVSALVGLGFSVAPIAPATLTGLNADFPITGGDTTTMIDHSGGLAFTNGGVTADIENFVINLTNDTLTGDLIVPGFAPNPNYVFFDIRAGDTLTLDASLAGALSAAYAIPNLTGAPIGTATVSAITAAAPEPGTASIAGLGLLLACVSLIGRRRLLCRAAQGLASRRPTVNEIAKRPAAMGRQSLQL